ncbi:putative serine/threonine-protein kinase-like protein CCR3 [Telopea speciosissima]|uniref:putative serine/threonine-protein kinase-like protein CCR3 n=1 Tax=Telopea speciosissima TaxID=54955 RepID=UPI001CC7FF6F|nr:putative serine/threonine-protein kinase-like protein CCR3 [Telopea speciosissima]
MMRIPSCVIVAIFFIAFVFPSVSVGLGSASTLSVSYESGTVCGILSGNSSQRIQCYRGGQTISILPNVSFEVISGGRNFFCGLTWDGSIMLCWDTSFSNTSFESKRVYYNTSVRLRDVTVGDDQVCAIAVETQVAMCWRGVGNRFPWPSMDQQFQSITSGGGFSCGILSSNGRVRCWGTNNSTAQEIQNQFGNISMNSLVAGGSHACGLNITGFLVCKGRNDSGQLEVPENSSFEFAELALGFNHSCATRSSNGSVVCWGGGGQFSSNFTNGIPFQLISAGSDFTCGLETRNLSVICWGPGMSMNASSSIYLPLPQIVPGPCTLTNCSCGQYPGSAGFCAGSATICRRNCLQAESPSPPSPPPALSPPPPASKSSSSKARDRGLLAFLIGGSIGCFSGLCTIVYCFWTGACCCKRKKIHNSVQPTITGGNANAGGNGSGDIFSLPLSRSSTIRRQSSRAMRRQRSGTSSKHADRAEEFSLAELEVATNNFSLENKIGSGSFGTVYKGKLADGRKVAIKRGETGTKTKKFQEKETAFESEIAFLSRLHHKYLVRLVGFCEEKDEKLLVYDYMKNGALYDHLHSKNNVEKSSSVLNSWKMRIKILLDAARGIEYLHNYAVPPIIHRDIKSSNILLDENWTARVSDFGLSLMGPQSPGEEYLSMKAAGTVGYMDPEYYGLHVLTAKSDVYGLGVVLLEILTGKRAIFKEEGEGGGPTSVVDYAVPKILAGELESVLDARVEPPEAHEAEAVELVAFTAVHCVNLEGKERPSMTDIVANLERAFSLCDGSHERFSSPTISNAPTESQRNSRIHTEDDITLD